LVNYQTVDVSMGTNVSVSGKHLLYNKKQSNTTQEINYFSHSSIP